MNAYLKRILIRMVCTLEITKIEIDGGFLNGFSLHLKAGLNVLIGARGTGKTSVIELVRYALGSKNYTEESTKKSLEHARAVLGSGEICVTLSDLIDEITVKRSVTDSQPFSSGDYIAPIVLSQTEIENIGLNANARIALIDGFIPKRNMFQSKKAELVNSLLVIFKEIKALEVDLFDLHAHEELEKKYSNEIAQLQLEQARLASSSNEFSLKQEELKKLIGAQTKIASEASVLDRFSASIEQWETFLDEKIMFDYGPEKWDQSGEDPLLEFRAEYSGAIDELQKQSKRFLSLRNKVGFKAEKLKQELTALENRLRQLRPELENIEQGAGATSRKLAFLTAELNKLASIKKGQREKANHISSLRLKRDQLLEEFISMIASRSNAREEVAEKLNDVLLPNVYIEIERAVNLDEYTKAITDALRGSGMKYNDLAQSISERVSPLELIRFLDENDFISFAEAAAIPKDRAARVLSYLKEVGISEIVTAEIEDNIKLSLLDGRDYKSTNDLSAGQRCTVILSIILQHSDRILIIDQPEDHLDNAFIAKTVIKALRERHDASQVILSTHNANIPVLGYANLVVEMTSDGRNGFIQVADTLKDSRVVESITNVMEGGADAFRQRRNFYEENSL
jgi:ABC-type dipeptide/oligopeptide/nickel transport system ATPase component